MYAPCNGGNVSEMGAPVPTCQSLIGVQLTKSILVSTKYPRPETEPQLNRTVPLGWTMGASRARDEEAFLGSVPAMNSARSLKPSPSVSVSGGCWVWTELRNCCSYASEMPLALMSVNE